MTARVVGGLAGGPRFVFWPADMNCVVHVVRRKNTDCITAAHGERKDMRCQTSYDRAT